jgi:hypothetical protein
MDELKKGRREMEGSREERGMESWDVQRKLQRVRTRA